MKYDIYDYIYDICDIYDFFFEGAKNACTEIICGRVFHQKEFRPVAWRKQPFFIWSYPLLTIFKSGAERNTKAILN